MAKQSGLGDRLFVNGFDISGDVGAVSRIANPAATLNVTSILASAMERIYGQRDGALQFNSFFNDDDSAGAEGAFEVLKGLPTTDVHVLYLHGSTLGGPAAGMVAKQVGYDPTRGADGSLTFDTQMVSNGYGLLWGEQLTAGIDVIASAESGATLDGGAATNFGLTAFIHVLSLASGTPTVKIQDSADDSTYADLPLATFGTVAAGTAEVCQTAATENVARYLKPVTTGTFADLECVIVIVRHAALVIS